MFSNYRQGTFLLWSGISNRTEIENCNSWFSFYKLHTKVYVKSVVTSTFPQITYEINLFVQYILDINTPLGFHSLSELNHDTVQCSTMVSVLLSGLFWVLWDKPSIETLLGFFTDVPLPTDKWHLSSFSVLWTIDVTDMRQL